MLDLTRVVVHTCYTLVDITATGVTRADDAHQNKKRNQQRNYETLVQTIGLRGQPVYLETPKILRNQDLTKYLFGADHQGSHTVWKLVFGAEHAGVYTLNDENTGLLAADINHVPVVYNLDETAKLALPIFSTSLDSKNTYFTSEV